MTELTIYMLDHKTQAVAQIGLTEGVFEKIRSAVDVARTHNLSSVRFHNEQLGAMMFANHSIAQPGPDIDIIQVASGPEIEINLVDQETALVNFLEKHIHYSGRTFSHEVGFTYGFLEDLNLVAQDLNASDAVIAHPGIAWFEHGHSSSISELHSMARVPVLPGRVHHLHQEAKMISSVARLAYGESGHGIPQVARPSLSL